VSVHAGTLEDGSKTIRRHVPPVVNKSW